LSFRSARVRRAGKALFVCDVEGALDVLPLEPSQAELVEPLLAMERVDVAALWDGRYCTLCWAETPLGRWVANSEERTGRRRLCPLCLLGLRGYL